MRSQIRNGIKKVTSTGAPSRRGTAHLNPNYTLSDSLAVIRESDNNSLHNLPVYFRDDLNSPLVRIDGVWLPATDVPGYVRLENKPRRKLYDTARNEMVFA
jgi:hypothetical protein